MGFYQHSGEDLGWKFNDYLKINADLWGFTKDDKEFKNVPVNECSYQDVGIEPGGTTKMFPTA